MIGVTDNYSLSVRVEGAELLTDEPQFRQIVLRSQALNVLPQFKLAYVAVDESAFPLLNERHVMTVALHTGGNERYQADYRPLKTTHVPRGEQVLTVVEGVPYVSRRRSRVTARVPASEAIATVLDEGGYPFRTEDGPEFALRTTEPQNWIQPWVTDREFVQHCLRHSYVPGSFPVAAITSFEPSFRLYHAARLAVSEPRWRLGNTGGGRIPVSAAHPHGVQSGFDNLALGYPTDAWLFGLDGHAYARSPMDRPPPRLSNTRFNTAMESPRLGRLSYQTANHSPHYHRATHQNRSLGSLMAADRLKLSFLHDFRPFEPLDLVDYATVELDSDVAESPAVSSAYLVTEVTHRIVRRQYSATIAVARPGYDPLGGTAA